MTGQRVRGIVFDKDGTLFDFGRTWEAWAQKFLARTADGPEAAFRMGQAIGFDTRTGQFDRDSVVIAGTPREIAQALAVFMPDRSVDEIVAHVNEEAAQARQVEAVPLIPLLDDLLAAGYRLGVATNDAEGPARVHLDEAGIIDRFDFVAGFDSGHGGKPSPGQLLAFAGETGLLPAACVMVGDSRHDLAAGRAAGFATVGVLTGPAVGRDLQDLADAVLPDIGHLPGWLRDHIL